MNMAFSDVKPQSGMFVPLFQRQLPSVFREEERGKVSLQNIGTYLCGLITLNRKLVCFFY